MWKKGKHLKIAANWDSSRLQVLQLLVHVYLVSECLGWYFVIRFASAITEYFKFIDQDEIGLSENYSCVYTKTPRGHVGFLLCFYLYSTFNNSKMLAKVLHKDERLHSNKQYQWQICVTSLKQPGLRRGQEQEITWSKSSNKAAASQTDTLEPDRSALYIHQ